MNELDLSEFFPDHHEQSQDLTMTVNGQQVSRTVPVRLLLSDFLRHELNLRGTHVGCEHGVCGACTVFINGKTARACLQFAVQCDNAEITTIEGISPACNQLSVTQQAFKDCHGLQCGFCTPGYVIAIIEFVDTFVTSHDDPRTALSELSDDDIREAISGNLCRCTGYQNIVAAARQAIIKTAEERC